VTRHYSTAEHGPRLRTVVGFSRARWHSAGGRGPGAVRERFPDRQHGTGLSGNTDHRASSRAPRRGCPPRASQTTSPTDPGKHQTAPGLRPPAAPTGGNRRGRLNQHYHSRNSGRRGRGFVRAVRRIAMVHLCRGSGARREPSASPPSVAPAAPDVTGVVSRWGEISRNSHDSLRSGRRGEDLHPPG
jgi:hypothetical protein